MPCPVPVPVPRGLRPVTAAIALALGLTACGAGDRTDPARPVEVATPTVPSVEIPTELAYAPARLHPGERLVAASTTPPVAQRPVEVILRAAPVAASTSPTIVVSIPPAGTTPEDPVATETVAGLSVRIHEPRDLPTVSWRHGRTTFVVTGYNGAPRADVDAVIVALATGAGVLEPSPVPTTDPPSSGPDRPVVPAAGPLPAFAPPAGYELVAGPGPVPAGPEVVVETPAGPVTVTTIPDGADALASYAVGLFVTPARLPESAPPAHPAGPPIVFTPPPTAPPTTGTVEPSTTGTTITDTTTTAAPATGSLRPQVAGALWLEGADRVWLTWTVPSGTRLVVAAPSRDRALDVAGRLEPFGLTDRGELTRPPVPPIPSSPRLTPPR